MGWPDGDPQDWRAHLAAGLINFILWASIIAIAARYWRLF